MPIARCVKTSMPSIVPAGVPLAAESVEGVQQRCGDRPAARP